jgi:hypothetical protein
MFIEDLPHLCGCNNQGVFVELVTMLYYPKIASTRQCPGGRCVAFEKYDGTNLHWEWNPDFGWHSFGTRRDEFSLSQSGIRQFRHFHAHLAESVDLFRGGLSEDIEKVLRRQFLTFSNIRVFTEFFGPNSFAGLHKESDPKELVLFDVWAEPFGFIGPDQFILDFGHLSVARVIYKGRLTGTFAENVRKGKYKVNEGVVCKGGRGGADLWMAKIKTYAYRERLKAAFASKWEDYWE